MQSVTKKGFIKFKGIFYKLTPKRLAKAAKEFKDYKRIMDTDIRYLIT